MTIKNSQKGVALIITFFMMIIMLAMVLGLSVVLINEIKITTNAKASFLSYYAAEAGAEKTLYYDVYQAPNGGNGHGLCNMQHICTQNCSTFTVTGNSCTGSNCTDCEVKYTASFDSEANTVDALIYPDTTANSIPPYCKQTNKPGLYDLCISSQGSYANTSRTVTINSSPQISKDTYVYAITNSSNAYYLYQFKSSDMTKYTVNSPKTLHNTNPNAIAVSPDNQIIYVVSNSDNSHGTIDAYNAKDLTFIATASTTYSSCGIAKSVAVSPDSQRAYVYEICGGNQPGYLFYYTLVNNQFVISSTIVTTTYKLPSNGKITVAPNGNVYVPLATASGVSPQFTVYNADLTSSFSGLSVNDNPGAVLSGDGRYLYAYTTLTDSNGVSHYVVYGFNAANTNICNPGTHTCNTNASMTCNSDSDCGASNLLVPGNTCDPKGFVCDSTPTLACKSNSDCGASSLQLNLTYGGYQALKLAADPTGNYMYTQAGNNGNGTLEKFAANLSSQGSASSETAVGTASDIAVSHIGDKLYVSGATSKIAIFSTTDFSQSPSGNTDTYYVQGIGVATGGIQNKAVPFYTASP